MGPRAASSGPDQPGEPDDPADFGGCRILERLGQGGMGVVYRSEQCSPQREVALKVLHPGPVAAGLAARLEREAELLGRLTHPGIARVYESGIAPTPEGARPFLALELVDGRSITEHAA